MKMVDCPCCRRVKDDQQWCIVCDGQGRVASSVAALWILEGAVNPWDEFNGVPW